MSVQVTFLGGAGTVTGSKFLVQHAGRSLLVDCGLFQGYKQLRLRNWAALPVALGGIDAVALTHAHLDHSGYLPLLVRQGYRGPVWCTPGTRDLCRILLPDSGHIQEEDAQFANRKGFSKHQPALPLYTEQDARKCLKQLHSVAPLRLFEPLPGWQARFHGAGHILGASSLYLEVGGRRLLFSGDLGRCDDLLMFPPEAPPGADAVFAPDEFKAEAAKLAGSLDAVIDAVGNEEIINGALPLIRLGGTIGVYGVLAAPALTLCKASGPYNFNLIVHQWPTRWREREAQEPLCRWIREGQLKASQFVTHTFPVEQIREAFEAVRSGEVVKCLITF